MMMGCSPAQEESYVRLRRGRRRRPAGRGFRLCPRNRFSVRRLRAKLLTFVGLVGRYVRLLAKRLSPACGGGGGVAAGFPRSGGGSSSRRVLVAGDGAAGKPSSASFIRSNSFYAQAIAECLEFIKRNSVPAEEYAAAAAAGGRTLGGSAWKRGLS